MSVGGARAGAGGPTRDSTRVRFRILNPTRTVLERLAREQKYFIGTRLDVGKVIDELVRPLGTPEPLYLRIAREAGLLKA